MHSKKTMTVFGIVFKRRPANEADVFARILTKEDGLFSIVIKGALRPKSKLNPMTLNLSYGNYTVLTNKTSLSTLRTTANIKQFDRLFGDLKLNSYALYFLDLVDHAFVDYEPVGRTFDLIFSAINLLNEGVDPEIIRGLVELQMLQVFGVGPELAHCVVCGKIKGDFDYSIDLGGVICSDHFHEPIKRLHLKSKTVALMRTLGLVDIKKIGKISVNESLKYELITANDKIYRQTLDLNLKTKKFVDQLKLI